MNLTEAEINYLQAIHKLSIDGERVSTNALANEFSIAPASVTDMVQKLAEKRLVQYERYKGVHLTEESIAIAQQANSSLSLWESFLVKKLGFSAEEANNILPDFQSVRSESLTRKLKAFLKQENEGKTIIKEVEIIKEIPVEVIKEVKVPVEVIKEVPIQKKQPQQDLFHQSNQPKERISIGIPKRIIGLASTDQNLLDLIQQFDLKLGAELIILQSFSFDSSYLVRIDNQELILSKKLVEALVLK